MENEVEKYVHHNIDVLDLIGSSLIKKAQQEKLP